jgi:carboxyl-terminal processing protease
MTVDGKPQGLILDLRHNPGGLLTSAVRISNLFVDKPVNIVSGEDKDGHSVWARRADPRGGLFADVPTVVLINRGSASASEIVAGCLQAHGAAVVVGERTFGKGSVQTIHGISQDSRLKLTTQYYRLPSPDGGKSPGRLVHKRPGANIWGVDPDIEVPMSATQVVDAITLRQKAELIPLDDAEDAEADDEEQVDINDLLTKGIDPQLETALLILRAQAMTEPTVQHALRDAG